MAYKAVFAKPSVPRFLHLHLPDCLPLSPDVSFARITSSKHPPHRHCFQLPVRRVSEAGASELAVSSTKACHTHGSAGVDRGGCFAGSSPGIFRESFGESLLVSLRFPDAGGLGRRRIRRPGSLRDSGTYGLPKASWISQPQVLLWLQETSQPRLWAYRSGVFSGPETSVASGDFAAPCVLAESVGIGDLAAPVAPPHKDSSNQ